MKLLHKLEHWGDSHHPKWLDIIRVAFGLFLCYKGFDFLQNMGSLIGKMNHKMPFGAFAFILLGHYVVFAHILGGLMIAAGFFTRFACLIQLPILLGAVFFINIGGEIMRPYAELFTSILVLILLIYFLIIGNGRWALRLNEEEKKDTGMDNL
ncbi:MAG: DoxX family protein [Ferruginibacter sp.]